MATASGVPLSAIHCSRRRRAHQNSRSGCANCKLRRVKCDEAYPECRRCRSFGVYCNYDVRIPELQPLKSTNQTLNFQLPKDSLFLSGDTSMVEARTQFTVEDLSRFKRFRYQTAISLGPPGLQQLYQNEICRLMFRHPFLHHFGQTLVSIHDRYMSCTTSRRTVQEIRHWNRGVAQLNKTLSAPLHPVDRDAVWAAASMLGIITFASTEALAPEQSWPLAHGVESGPEWLKMGQGKSALWQLARPDRADSIFRNLLSAMPAVTSSLDSVPSNVIELYNLRGSSASSSPYALPVAGIFSLADAERSPSSSSSSSSTVGLFFALNGWMLGDFGHLVLARDPRALVILAHWYAKICTGEWWFRRRASIEGRATCLYLERHFPNHVEIQTLLKVPRQSMFHG